MGSGFLAGIFWGAVVGAGMLFVSTQTMDRQQLSFPKPEASPVEVPGGSEFDQARAETDPVLPGTEATPAADEPVAGVTVPEDAVETPPSFDTSALEVPEPSIEAPGEMAAVPEPADEVEVPPAAGQDRVGSSGNLAGGPDAPALDAPEAPIAAPEADTMSPAPGEAPGADAPVVAEPGGEDTQPEVEVAALPDSLTEPAPEPQESAPSVEIGADSPVSPVSPEISEAPSLPGVQSPEPVVPPSAEDLAALAPSDDEAPELAPVTEAPAPSEAEPTPQPDPEPAAEPDTAEDGGDDDGGIVTVDGGDSKFFTPVETFDDRAENVETDRLPTIGDDDENSLPVVRRLPGTPITGDDGADAEPDAAAGAGTGPQAIQDGPALSAFAMDYTAPSGAALVSVVLLHEGGLPDEATLAALPDTVAFAVDAGTPDASEVAAAYRRAGREVVLIPSLPVMASPQDVEVAFDVNLGRIPQAVAVMDVTGSSFQSDRQAVAQIVAVVSDTGHGIITFPRGLNTAHQQAERAGVPTGLIFRMLDDDGESDEQIGRALDRAAFRARQSDGVILIGHLRPGTIAAVAEWAESAGEVSLAPVSAVLSGG